MSQRENVQKICDMLNLQNPIREEDLRIAALVFHTETQETVVEATDMNRAGRLFVQYLAEGRTRLPLEPFRNKAKEFFTAQLWDDCSSTNRSLVYGFKTADIVEIHHKK